MKELQDHLPGTIQVGLVEDQILFRKGIKAILSAWPEINVMFESSDGYSVISKLKESMPVPDVMLVDLSLPAEGTKEYSGLDLTEALRVSFPGIKIIILSVHDDAHFVSKLIKSGAHGYLAKDCNPQEVYQAILDVHKTGAHINKKTLDAIQNDFSKKNTARKLNLRFNGVQLTKREEEILNLICMQKTTEEIAEELFISPRTVNGHRNNLLQKTNSRNVAGLVAFALSGK
ncbi:MAG: response regulator transcription factor [Bacteroidota bacterium]